MIADLVYFYGMYRRDKNRLLAIGGLSILLAFMQWQYFSLYPTSIHAWAQSDFFSLARGFMRNGFNFFLPEEYIFNKQFPHDWQVADSTTITAANFPIHQYLVALLMKLAGTEGPVIFRLYTFAFSILGLNYLFKSATLLRLTSTQAFLITLLAAFSPLFLFYQANFMVTIPSLATTIWGVYHYLRFLDCNSRKNWQYAIVLLTLSALTRTTFVIPLIAVCGHQVLIMWRTRTWQPRLGIAPATGFTMIIVYQLYNNYLMARYGSHFLSSLKPARDLGEFKSFLSDIYENWSDDYFSPVQWLVLGILTLLTLRKAFRTRQWKAKHPAIFIGIYFFGCLLFFIAMCRQFIFHDYYFLDTFFLPVLLMVGFGLRSAPDLIKEQRIRITLLSIAALLIILDGRHLLYTRYTVDSNDVVSRTIKAYSTAPELLAKNKVPRDARILVFGSYGPNAPFLMMDRKGYSVDHITPEFFNIIQQWDSDYIVVSNFFLRDVLIPSFPYVSEHLLPIATNFDVTLFRWGQHEPAQDLLSLIDPKPSDFHYFSLHVPGSSDNSYWEFLPRTVSTDTGQVFAIDSSEQFGFKWGAPVSEISGTLSPRIFTLRAKMKLLHPERANEIDVFGQTEASSLFFHTFKIDERAKKTSDWQWVEIYDELPPTAAGYTLGFHHYNAGGASILLDSIQVGIY